MGVGWAVMNVNSQRTSEKLRYEERSEEVKGGAMSLNQELRDPTKRGLGVVSHDKRRARGGRGRGWRNSEEGRGIGLASRQSFVELLVE